RGAQHLAGGRLRIFPPHFRRLLRPARVRAVDSHFGLREGRRRHGLSSCRVEKRNLHRRAAHVVTQEIFGSDHTYSILSVLVWVVKKNEKIPNSLNLYVFRPGIQSTSDRCCVSEG